MKKRGVEATESGFSIRGLSSKAIEETLRGLTEENPNMTLSEAIEKIKQIQSKEEKGEGEKGGERKE